MGGLVQELRRRNVFRAAVLYIVTAWVILQVAETLLPVFAVPDWVLRAIILLLAVLFPIMLLLSWAYELTPEGIRPESQVRRPGITSDESVADLVAPLFTGRRLDFLIIALLLIAVGLLVARQELFLVPQIAEQERVTSNVPSIAVLPFDNMSGDEKYHYLAEGFSEEILNTLVQVPRLQVVGRTSSFGLDDSSRDLRVIGEQLDATHILEGSLRKDGEKLRVTAQLIDSSSGFHVWSDVYDADFENIIEVQEDIASEIVSAMRLELASGDMDALEAGTDDPKAYDLYLQAKDKLRHAKGPADADAAIRLINASLKRAPLFAGAEGVKCEAYRSKYEFTRSTEFIEPAIASCRRAVSIAPNSAEVRTQLGRLLLETGQDELALEELQGAARSASARADTFAVLGQAYQSVGNEAEARANFERAVEMQPRDASLWNGYGNFLSIRGQTDAATDALHRATELEPNNPSFLNDFAVHLAFAGEFGEAGAVFEKATRVDPTGRALSNAATHFYLSGAYNRASQLLSEAAQLSPDEFRIWGNLGDICRYATNCRREPAYYYGEALRLAQSQLAVDPQDTAVLSLSAWYLVQLGNTPEGLQTLSRATELEVNGEVAWIAAAVHATLGHEEQAREWIKRAIEYGVPVIMIAADPDLRDFVG